MQVLGWCHDLVVSFVADGFDEEEEEELQDPNDIESAESSDRVKERFSVGNLSADTAELASPISLRATIKEVQRFPFSSIASRTHTLWLISALNPMRRSWIRRYFDPCFCPPFVFMLSQSTSTIATGVVGGVKMIANTTSNVVVGTTTMVISRLLSHYHCHWALFNYGACFIVEVVGGAATVVGGAAAAMASAASKTPVLQNIVMPRVHRLPFFEFFFRRIFCSFIVLISCSSLAAVSGMRTK